VNPAAPSPFAFLFGVHNHQPVGNFRSVFEQAFADSYRPFLEALLRYPGVKVTAHYSGPLLEYMEAREKTCWDFLRELVGRGQVELLGGGFYEPILTIIPEEDRQGQIRMMSDFLAEHFGRRPRGIWLTERVWEPSLPKTLGRAGIEYSLLDEEHFHYAGIRDLHAYHITEDEGFSLKIFPIDKKLRYLIPFRGLEEIGSRFDDIAALGGLAVLGDDGEKFGLWPGTKAWVYGEGWLDRFLTFLESRGVRTLTFAEALDSRPPAGRVYLPPASYEEMMEWVLEPAAAARLEDLKRAVPVESRRFLRGGFFREFFLKYPESHHLHKRMLHVSKKVRESGRTQALKDLYRAQGNDPYWHGVFGGLYLPHLREAAYESLLKAESALPPEAAWTAVDFDCDGRLELVWRDERIGLFVKPSAGGAIIEIDDLPLARNLTDVLSRRPEAYHVRRDPADSTGGSIHELAKELPPGAERLFRYDLRPRWSCLDRFLESETGPERLGEDERRDLGDFADRDYQWIASGPVLRLSCLGSVRVGEEPVFVRIEKDIIPDQTGFRVVTRLRNEGGTRASFLFAPEWSFYQIESEISSENDGVLLCSGRWTFRIEPSGVIGQVPIETLSQSEKGFDIIRQGVCLRPCWPVELDPFASFTAEVVLKKTAKSENEDG